MKYVDVNDRSEIPQAPSGWRYLDFLGGSTGLRAYLVPEGLPRLDFVREHAALLDPVLAPIYECEGISVRQDASYALPGFYILSFDRHYRSLDEIDTVTHLRSTFLIREVRLAMREAIDVQYVHIHYEEKPSESCNVHYWLMPVRDPDTNESPPITRLNIKEYLRRFKFPEERPRMLAYNEAMVRHFEATGLRVRDQELQIALKRTA